MESLWLLPLFLFFLLITVGQVVRIYISYNLYENLGLIVFKFFIFKVVQISFDLSPSSITIRSKKKTKNISFEFSDPHLKFAENFAVQIKDKLRVKELSLCARIGLEEAEKTATICGAVDVMFKSFVCYVKNIKPTASVNAVTYASFNKKIIEVSFYGKMSLSIFDFLYAILFSLLIEKNT